MTLCATSGPRRHLYPADVDNRGDKYRTPDNGVPFDDTNPQHLRMLAESASLVRLRSTVMGSLDYVSIVIRHMAERGVWVDIEHDAESLYEHLPAELKPRRTEKQSPKAQAKKKESSLVTARRLTVQCPKQGCEAFVVRISRTGNAEWDLDRTVLPPIWNLQPDQHSLFQLSCSKGHKTERLGKDLPKRLQAVVSSADPC